MARQLTTLEHRDIALTIFAQLGGRQFKSMCGVERIIALTDEPRGGVDIRFKGSRKLNCIRVLVDASDTYTVEFWRITRRSITAQPAKRLERIYAEDLRRIFEETTGLQTSLGTMGE